MARHELESAVMPTSIHETHLRHISPNTEDKHRRAASPFFDSPLSTHLSRARHEDIPSGVDHVLSLIYDGLDTIATGRAAALDIRACITIQLYELGAIVT